MKKLIAIVISAAIAGCSTTRHDAEIVKAQAEQKTLVISCADCKGLKIGYRSPNAVVNTPTNGWDAVNNVTHALTGALVGVAPYVALAEGFRYMGQSSSSISGSYNQSSSATSTDTNQQYSYQQQTETVTQSETPLIFLGSSQPIQGE